MSLLGLPNEIILEIATNLDSHGVKNLIEAHGFLNNLLLPVLNNAIDNEYGEGNYLLWAATTGYTNWVKAILGSGAGAGMNHGQSGEALHSAAAGGHQGVINLLLENGINVDARSTKGDTRTALHCAARMGRAAVAKLLLENGSDIYARFKGDTALHVAAAWGKNSVIEVLLNYGINIDTLNTGPDRTTALIQTSLRGNLTTLSLLLAKGANPNIQDTNGLTALHSTTRRSTYDPPPGVATVFPIPNDVVMSVINLLLESGTDPNIQDATGQTALHFAAYYGHEEMAKSILENRGLADLQDNWSQAALHLAVLNKHDAVVAVLLGKGASSDIENFYGQTALQIAEGTGNAEMVNLMNVSRNGAFANQYSRAMGVLVPEIVMGFL